MKRQNGFTLIELMIASLIGVFLMAAIMNLFITTNRTVTLSEAMSQNQETGRFSMDYLTRFIRNAGYTADTTLSPPELLIANANPAFTFTCLAGAAEFDACSSNNPDPDTIRGDRLSVVYVVGGGAGDERTTCSGSDVGGTLNGQQFLADVFWVSNTAPNIGELRCRTYNIGTGWLDQNAVSIINNIEAFEFQVGIANSDTASSASSYVSVDNVILNGLNNRIRSLRVAILTTSTDALDDERAQTEEKVRRYGVLDAPQVDGALTFDDASLRNIFISTIELPGSIESAVEN